MGDYLTNHPHYIQGVIAERERIIELIREIEKRHTNFYQLATTGEIIRFIEGENK